MAIPEEHFNTLSESRSNKPVQRSYKSLLTRKKTCSCFLNCLTSVFPGSNSLPFKRPVHRPSNIPLSITLEETSPNLSSLIYEHHYAIAFWKTWLLQNKKDVYIYIHIHIHIQYTYIVKFQVSSRLLKIGQEQLLSACSSKVKANASALAPQ